MSFVDMRKARAAMGDGAVRERVAGGELDDRDRELTEKKALLIQAAQEPELKGFGLPGLMGSNPISACFLGQSCDGRDPRKQMSFDVRAPGVWARANQNVDWTIVQ